MVSGWIINELPKWIVFGTWMLLNIALFIFQFNSFQVADKYFYMRLRTREALAFARGPALPINFNAILILLPVCRNLISFIRGTGRCPPRTIKRLLDKNLTFHKAIAWVIVLSSAIHVIAHWYNYERLLATPTLAVFRERIPWEYRSIPNNAQPDLSDYIDADIQLDPITICFVTVAGITGHVITIALFLMVTSSLEFIRRSYFEVFWYTHHLFIVFLVGLAFHQYQRLLPVQTNVDDHDPAYCSLFAEQGAPNVDGGFLPADGSVVINNVTLCPAAEFTPAPATAWAYMLGGLIIYSIERIVRLVRSLRKVVIVKVVEHPSKTIEIQMRSKGFYAEAGQYVFVNVPSVALFEWHPFTLTSAPEEDYFSVHIRIVGDWTEEVARQMGAGRGDFQQSWELPRIAIDGPFGTASEDVFDREVGVLVGAGIGVTPFASILKSVYYKLIDENTKIRLKKVYFYWICPEPTAFEWFADLLLSLEKQMADKGISTGVGVFFCGPPVLSHNLHRYCNEYTRQGDSTRARFYYNKENF